MRTATSIIVSVFIVAASAVAFALLREERLVVPNDQRIRVAATIAPLAEFSRAVGGDAVLVETLTPAGVEPHDFEPTPQQVARVYDAQLVLVNGGGIDAWAERLLPSVAQPRTEIVVATRVVADRLLGAGTEVVDPHVWLHPVLAQRIVAAIRDALIALDPEHTDVYRRNAAAYSAELASLDRAYRDGLASCAQRTVIASHAAFAYLAEAYGFELLSIAGLSPDAEPSAGALAALANVARSRGVRHVFFETLVSPTLAEALAREIGAQTLVFNPIEGFTDAEIAAGASYLSVMRTNLENLLIAMVCP